MISLLLMVSTSSFAADVQTVQMTLAQRDGMSCAQLGTADATLRDQLLSLTAPDLMPPSVPIRAAECLVELYPTDPTVHTAFTAWMSDSERAGLALLVIGRLDRLPLTTAVQLATAALQTPDTTMRARFQSRLTQSPIPEVRAVVTPQ